MAKPTGRNPDEATKARYLAYYGDLGCVVGVGSEGLPASDASWHHLNHDKYDARFPNFVRLNLGINQNLFRLHNAACRRQSKKRSRVPVEINVKGLSADYFIQAAGNHYRAWRYGKAYACARLACYVTDYSTDEPGRRLWVAATALQYARRHLDWDLFREVLIAHVKPALTLAEARNGPSVSASVACVLIRECTQLVSEGRPESIHKELTERLYLLECRNSFAAMSPLLYSSMLRHIIYERLNSGYPDSEVKRLLAQARAAAPDSQQNQTALDYYEVMFAVRRGEMRHAYAWSRRRIEQVAAIIDDSGTGAPDTDLTHGTTAASFLFHAAVSRLAGENKRLDDTIQRALSLYDHSVGRAPNRAKLVAAPGLIEAAMRVPALSSVVKDRIMPRPPVNLVALCQSVASRVLAQTG